MTSRASTANSSLARSGSNAMLLPNIPRLNADEKSRFKYISEYEKLEPELRRHHIGTAETTNTLGLKDVPADFDRRVPLMSDPTRAEIEFGRQHTGRARSAKKVASGGTAGSTKGTAAATALFPSEAAAAPKRGTTQSNSPSSTQQPQQRLSAAEIRPSSGRRASQEGPLPRENKEPLLFLAATAAAAGTAAAFPSALSKKLVAAAADAKVPMSIPRLRSAPPPPTKTTAQRSTSLPDKKAFKAPRCDSVRRASTTPAPPPAPPARSLTSAEEVARVLCVLLDPPPQYVSSLDLDLSCLDLEWLRNGAATPRHLTNITNYCDGLDAGNAPLKVNSPRSVITFLEHGVSLTDWVEDDADSNAHRGDCAGDSSGSVSTRLRAELQQHRRAHRQAQRRAACAELEKSYLAFCSQVSLQDVLACYRQARRASLNSNAAIVAQEIAAVSTAVIQRRERQRRVFETNKMRMLRQVQQAKELQERQEAAEQRQQQAELDAEEERRRKATEEETARRLQQERLAARRAEREQREEAAWRQLQSRMVKAEARNAEQVAARERQRRVLQEEREARATERAQRVARITATLEEQAARQDQKRLEKERKVAEMRLAREARLAEEQRLQTEKHQRAAQQRDEARQRAAEAEEAARAAALERQAQVETRLQGFYGRRRDEAAQRAALEAEHQKRLEEARAEAYAKEAQFKRATQEKLVQHEERYQDTRAHQLADIAWRRAAEREEQEDKAYVVLQLQRKAEYQKLYTVADLLEKRRAANAVTQQRNLICEQAMRERDKLREERDALKKQLASSAP